MRVSPPRLTGIATAVAAVAVLVLMPAAAADRATQVSPKIEEAEVVVSEAERKAKTVIIPELKFQETTMMECLEILKRKSRELDPKKEGINFVVNLPKDHSYATTRITFDLRNIPVSEAIKYVTNLANCGYRFDPHAVVVLQTRRGCFTNKEYPLSPEKVEALLGPSKKSSRDTNDFTTYFREMGVTLQEGTRIAYFKDSKTLLAQGVPETLDPIDDLVAPMLKPAPPRPVTPAEARLQKIRISKLDIREMSLREAVEFLAKNIRGLDPEGDDMFLEIGGNVEADLRRMTINLSNIPAFEVLKYVTALSDTKFRIAADNHIIIVPLDAPDSLGSTGS